MKSSKYSRVYFALLVGLVGTVLLNVGPGNDSPRIAGPAFIWAVYFYFKSRTQSSVEKVTNPRSFAEQFLPLRLLEAVDVWRYRDYFSTIARFGLTKSQIRAAVSRSKSTMVIAGAGSGKTTLVVAKAKYLMEKKRHPEGTILILAFNKKVANEINERLLDGGMPPVARTFHGFGSSLLTRAKSERLRFTEASELELFINREFSRLLESPLHSEVVIEYLTSLLVPVPAIENFKHMSDDAQSVRAMPRTLAGEQVKSYGEWVIANSLWKLGVPYQYEKGYRGVDVNHRHLPDFSILNTKVFVEYFGIDGLGNTAPYIDKEKYNKSIQWKRQVHELNGTYLIELTYQDVLDKKLESKLQAALIAANIAFQKRSPQQISDQVVKVKYVFNATKVISAFHSQVRTKRKVFDELRFKARGDSRSLAFLDIYEEIHGSYIEALDGDWDFSDFIHGAIERLKSGEFTLPYRHIIVDEYQDISEDRRKLVDASLKHATNAKLTVVGDDWQSIYRFAGSELSSMIGKGSLATSAKKIRMGETFRFGQAVADVSSDFIMQNPSQLEKQIISSLPIYSSMICHWDTVVGDTEANLESILSQIQDASNPEKSLLVIARYSNNLPSQDWLATRWAGQIQRTSIHSAKGLEADYVIVCDLFGDNRGFPSIIQDDPVMSLVMEEEIVFEFDEERRVFYVAITRARQECHMVTPAAAPSVFALELRKYENVQHVGQGEQYLCPLCLAGSLVMDGASGSYRCSNSPLCRIPMPKCLVCQKSGMMTGVEPSSFECVEHGPIEDRCPECDLGRVSAFVTDYATYWNCHMWVITDCVGGQPRRQESIDSISY